MPSDAPAHLSTWQVVGEEHPDTLTSMNNLAKCLDDQSKHSEAEPLYWQTLAASQKVSLTLDGMGPLIACQRRQRGSNIPQKNKQQANSYSEGRVKKANEWHDSRQLQVSQIKCMRIPSVAGCDGAAPHPQQQVLGEEHPDTIGFMNNLANCLNNQSKHSKAEPLYRQALAARQKVGLTMGWDGTIHCLLQMQWREQ